MVLHVIVYYITLANEFLTFFIAATYLCEALSRSRRRRRLRSAGARFSGALRDLLLRYGDQEARRYIENI